MEQRQNTRQDRQTQHALPYIIQLQQMPPLDYFKVLRRKFKKAKQLFWQEVLSGLILDKLFQRYGLNFMRSVSCEVPTMMIATLQMAINFEWMPRRLRHITLGLFFPLLFLLLINYNVAVGVGQGDELLTTLIFSTLGLYLLVGFRSSGQLKTEQMQLRPYLQTPKTSCNSCDIIRPFRSTHCPICQICVSKQTRHSLIFGICIGAANELLCLLFYYFFYLAQFNLVYLFVTTKSYGLLTKFMFYSVNTIIIWQTFVEFLNLLILNFGFGITEQQLRTWPTQQYLLKMPEREFVNNCNQGFIYNLIGSVFALLGIRGYESENNQMANPLSFAPIDTQRSYFINWAKAMFYLIPQLPTHKNRAQVQQILQREQPRMIQMYKLQQQFKEEVMSESANQLINQSQFQQRMAMKMQAHMMKGMPQIAQTSTTQQRAMHLQILAHMKKEYSFQPDLIVQIQQLQEDIIKNKVTPVDITMRIQQLQQQIMTHKMGQSVKDQENQEEGSMISINESPRQKQNEEEQLAMKIINDSL